MVVLECVLFGNTVGVIVPDVCDSSEVVWDEDAVVPVDAEIVSPVVADGEKPAGADVGIPAASVLGAPAASVVGTPAAPDVVFPAAGGSCLRPKCCSLSRRSCNPVDDDAAWLEVAVVASGPDIVYTDSMCSDS